MGEWISVEKEMYDELMQSHVCLFYLARLAKVRAEMGDELSECDFFKALDFFDVGEMTKKSLYDWH